MAAESCGYVYICINTLFMAANVCVCVSIFQPMNEGGFEDVCYTRKMFCAHIDP